LEFNPPYISGVPNLFTLNIECKACQELAWRLQYHSAAQKLCRQKSKKKKKPKNKIKKKGVEVGVMMKKLTGPYIRWQQLALT